MEESFEINSGGQFWRSLQAKIAPQSLFYLLWIINVDGYQSYFSFLFLLVSMLKLTNFKQRRTAHIRALRLWNSDRNLITTNFLVNYIYRPGSDFYLVFNQTYGTDSLTSGLMDTAVVGKVTYWWNP